MGFCCIYNKEIKGNLHFQKQEHVIPAGLGGISKLEKGIVSDEVNEMFSKIELKALRNSLLSVNRTNLGPGKRGNLNVNKIKNPIMRVLQQNEEESEYEFFLGFIYAGTSYIIPQLLLEFNDNEGSVKPIFIASPFQEDIVKDFPLDFNKKIRQFLKSRKRSFKLVEMPFKTNSHFISIGFYKGRWYGATSHKFINMDVVAFEFLPMIEEMINNQIVYFKEPTINDNKPILKYTNILDMDMEIFYFLYVKTAFNALAFFKGNEFVNTEIFDNVRNAILNKEDLGDFIDDKEDVKIELEEYIHNIPDKAHYIIINAKDTVIKAYVSFYGESPANINLTTKYQGKPFIDGLICDWKNRLEFRL